MGKQVVAGSNGGLAQLGEHLPCKQGVESSNLLVSTKAMRSGFLGTEDECACTDESCRDRKGRANARDEAGLPANPTLNCFKQTEMFAQHKAVCTLKTEYRIKESIKPCEIWKVERNGSRKYFMEIETRHLKATSKQEVMHYYAR